MILEVALISNLLYSYHTETTDEDLDMTTTYALSYMDHYQFEVTAINGPFDTFADAMRYAHAWADDISVGSLTAGRELVKSHFQEDWSNPPPGERLFSGIVELVGKEQEEQVGTINVYPLIKVAQDYAFNEAGVE